MLYWQKLSVISSVTSERATGCSLHIVIFPKNSQKFATSPTLALVCCWLYKKRPANKRDCTLVMRWELRRSLTAICRRGRRCSELWKKPTIFPKHSVSCLFVSTWTHEIPFYFIHHLYKPQDMSVCRWRRPCDQPSLQNIVLFKIMQVAVSLLLCQLKQWRYT